MAQKILISTQMMIHDQARFRKWLTELGFDVDFLMNDQFLTEAECLKIEPIYDGWIAGDDQVTSRVIDHLKPKLKVISKWGTGIDSIDKIYAESNGTQIKNSPGVFSDAVGEMAVSYLLSLTRGVVETDRDIRNGLWPKKQYRTLIGMKIGFIGMGAIGLGAAKRLKLLGCDIYFSDPAVEEYNEYIKRDVENLFSEMDAIIVTSNLNPSTLKLVNKELFDLITDPIYLVNVGRGPIVCEKSLIEALHANKLMGVALDVFEIEPLKIENQLRDFNCVILGSHNANNTIDAVQYVHRNTIDNLCDVLNKAHYA